VFTARYALSPYLKQTRFVFKGLIIQAYAQGIACNGERRRAYRILVGKREGKRLLEEPRRRWEDNIKVDLQEMEYESVGWIDLAQEGNL
jgi:hypothetical protein